MNRKKQLNEDIQSREKDTSNVLPSDFISELTRLAGLFYSDNYDIDKECYDDTKGEIDAVGRYEPVEGRFGIRPIHTGRRPVDPIGVVRNCER